MHNIINFSLRPLFAKTISMGENRGWLLEGHGKAGMFARQPNTKLCVKDRGCSLQQLHFRGESVQHEPLSSGHPGQPTHSGRGHR